MMMMANVATAGGDVVRQAAGQAIQTWGSPARGEQGGPGTRTTHCSLSFPVFNILYNVCQHV